MSKQKNKSITKAASLNVEKSQLADAPAVQDNPAPHDLTGLKPNTPKGRSRKDRLELEEQELHNESQLNAASFVDELSSEAIAPSQTNQLILAQVAESLTVSAASGVGAGVTGVGLAGSAGAISASLGMAGMATGAVVATVSNFAAGAVTAIGAVATQHLLKDDDTAPTIAATQSFNFSENSSANANIGMVQASDPVGVTDFRFSATGTSISADGYFRISANGAVTLTAAGAAAGVASNDFETGANSFTYGVQARNVAGNWSVGTEVTFRLTNLDEVAPTITSAEQASVNENVAAGAVVYTVTSDDTADTSDGVTYSLKPGQDASAFSIDPVTGEVTIKEGPDRESKSTYIFTVVVTDAAGFSSEQTVTLAIENFEEAPTILSVEPTLFSDVSSPAQGKTVLIEFTVQRAGDRNDESAATVDWILEGLSATDFPGGVLPSGTVEFAQGSTTASLVVQVPASYSFEALRQATVRLNNPSTGFAIDLDNAQATVRIVDDANVLGSGQVFTISADKSTTLSEGGVGHNTVITYTVTRTGVTSEALELGYVLGASGSALVTANDFANDQGAPLTALPAGRIAFSAGSPTASFSITVRGDDDVGPDEAFDIALTDLPNGSRVIGKTSGLILNDDVYISVVSQAIVNAGNGEVTHTFLVRRAGGLDDTHTVAYTVAGVGEQATSRFDQTARQITFAPGQEEKEISFTTPAGQTIAGYQTFAIQLSAASGHNYTLLNDRATSSIHPNLQDVEMSANLDRVLEGTDTDFSYTVTRSGVIDDPLTLRWSVEATSENGVSAADFQGALLPSGSITFAANQSSATIRFKTAQDAGLEGTEGFRLKLVSENLPAGVRLITPQIEGFIADDESALGFRQNAVFEAVEGDTGISNLSVTVSRVGFTGNASTVQWRVTPGSASLADLVSGQDRLGDNNGFPSGVLTLLPGQAAADITVRIAGDSLYEGGETLGVTLSNASAGTTVIGTEGVSFPGYANAIEAIILNDDALIGLESSRVLFEERNGGTNQFVEITVTRTGSTAGEDTVKWSLSSIQSGVSADNSDIGIENDAVGVFNRLENSWIDVANFKGTQSAQGTVQVTKSGYVLVAYDRDKRFNDYDDGNLIFDQFLLKTLSISDGASLSATGPLADHDYIASNAAISNYGQSLFEDVDGLSLPGEEEGGQRVVISSTNNLGGVYFRVSGLDGNGQPISEVIRGSDGGASATVALFSTVTKIETLAPGFSVGRVDVPTDDYDYYDDSYLSRLQLAWASGDAVGMRNATADDYGRNSRVAGAEFESDMSYPVLRSEADLSDATFVIKGGLSVAYFSVFSSNSTGRDFQEGDGIYGHDDTLRFDVPQFIRAEQVSGMFQTLDGSSAPNRFMVTGINQTGEKISEVIEVADFDPDGLAAVNSYSGGNLLAGSVTLQGGARLMISTNGDADTQVVVLTEEFFLEQFGFATLDEVNNINIRNIYSGSVERFDGGVWTTVDSWSGINKDDLAAGNIRVVGGLAGASFELGVYDQNWNEKTQILEPVSGAEFTVSGRDAQGREISETLSAPDFYFGFNGNGREADKATVATKKSFETIDSVVANQDFSANIQIGVSRPVSTTNAFIELYGVAAVDEQGNYIDPGSAEFSGKIEFTVPLEVTLQGPKTGVVISPQLMNYIHSIEVQRHLPEDIRVNIGYQASDLGTSVPGSQRFLVLANSEDALTAEINNNFSFNTSTRWETGNVNPDQGPNKGYAIFRIDAPEATVDNPATISFDVAQLGRYGFDLGRIAYAPDGTFSTDVNDLIQDSQNLLIPVLEAGGPETTEAQGEVVLPGSGYIWVRYANLSNSQEGSDRATIRSLYVDQGARLSIVGQKAISDGVASTQSIDGNTELNLNGVSVSYLMPDHSRLNGDVMLYVRQSDIEKFDGLYFDLVGKSSEGLTVTRNEYFSSFYGSERPNDGMVRFKTLESLGIETLERFTWEEETSSNQMWEPRFGLVKGSLSRLAEDIPVSIKTEELFSVSYYSDEYSPGAPRNVSYQVAGQQVDKTIPVEQVLPEFARSILYAQALTEASQSISVDVRYDAAQRLTLTSTQDLSGRLITVSGTGAQGQPLEEVLHGPNASTITTIAKFMTVTGVSVDAGDALGELSMGQVLAFSSPVALSAYSYDGMAHATFTARGRDANGEVVSVELEGLETSVSHPLGAFSELWSLSNDGRASEYLSVRVANAQKTVLSVNEYGESTLNLIADNQAIGQDDTEFGGWFSAGNFQLPASPLVFDASPALAGRIIRFNGYSPGRDWGQVYEYQIPESGLFVTPVAFQDVWSITVLGGEGAGQIDVSFAQSITRQNADPVLRSTSDFSGDLVFNGLDGEGHPVSRSFDTLAANTDLPVTGLAVLLSYSYSGAGPAPALSLVSVPRHGFFQPISLSGEVDAQGYIELGTEQHVVITVNGSDAEKQIFKVTGLVNGERFTETLVGIADTGVSVITQNLFTHLLSVEVGSSDYDKDQRYSIGTFSPILPEQVISRYGADMKLGEAVAVLESPSKVSITSSDNLSSSSFVVTGRDAAGQEFTETLPGPNASTVLSTRAFSQVLSIQALGGASGQVKVGYVTQGGAMVDGFIVAGQGTESNPYTGHSTNTLETSLDSSNHASGIYSESDVLLYVDTRGSQGPVTLHYDLAVQGSAGSGGNSLADRLYVEFSATEVPLLSGEVTFAEGASEAVIQVPIAGDDRRELDESLRLRLDSASAGANLDESRRSSELIILNDDDVVNLVAAPQSGSEGNTPQEGGVLRFTVNRQIDRGELDVHWHIAGLSSAGQPLEGAGEAEDFVTTSGVVSFSAGSLSAVIEVQLVADRLFEGDEAFQLVLSQPPLGGGYGLGTSVTAAGTIVEDDVGLRIDATGAVRAETDDRTIHTFTVNRLGDVDQSSFLVWSVAPTSSADNTDALPVDFGGSLPPQQTLVFAAGESEKTITVTTIGDNEMTGDRHFILTVANGAGDTTDVRAASATGTIVEDDPVDLSVSPVEIRQSEASLPLGFSEFTYTLTRHDDSRAADYAWTVLPGDDPLNTAAMVTDFEDGQDVLGSNGGLPSGRLQFAAGESAKTIKIKVLSDTLIEGDEAFKLHFVGTDASEASPQDITAYIVNDTPGYGIDVTYAGQAQGDTLLEGSDGTRPLKITFFRSGGTGSEETLNFSMTGGANAAASLADFVGLSVFPENELIVFAPGQSAVTRTYMVQADSVLESDETLSVELKALGGATLASRSLTLRNDDAVVDIEARAETLNEETAAEGAANEDLYSILTYRVYRTGAPDQGSSVQWRVKAENGINANDFVNDSGGLPSGTVTFSANEAVSYKEFSVQVTKDSVDENDYEDLVVELYNPSAGTLVGTAAVTTRIVDDDETNSGGSGGSGGNGNSSGGGGGGSVTFDPPVWSVLALSTRQTESDANTSFTFTVQRPSDSNPGVTTIRYRIGADSAALEGYSAASSDIVDGFGEQSLVFEQGEFVKTATVVVRGDQLPENHESFAITLVSASRGTLDQNQQSLIVTIGNDDSGFSVVAGAPVLEGDQRGQAFVIARDFATDINQAIHWSIGGSGVHQASVDDFAGPLSGITTFTGAELTRTVYVPFSSDAVIELDETFTFSIALGDGAADDTIVQETAVGTILGDDSMLSVVFDSGKDRVREGTGDDIQFVEFLIRRDFGSAGPASVNWTLTGDAVAAGLLPQGSTSGSVAFTDGESVKTVKIAVTPNQAISGDKTFLIQLDGAIGSGLLIGSGDTATGTVFDDDSVVSIRGDASVVEGDSGAKVMTLVIDRTGGTAYASEVGWQVVSTSSGAGNASGSDFTGSLLPSGTLSLGAGQSQIQLAIPGIMGDRNIEGDETFRIELVPTVSPDFGLSIDPARSTALGTIIDNDSRVDLIAVFSAAQPALVPEGASLTFTVQRTGYLGAVSLIDWNLVPAEGYTNGMGDFAQPSGTLKFGIGQSSLTFSVSVNADNVSELDELFRLSLTSTSSGTTVGVSESYLKVVNDDADRISVSATPSVQAEGDGAGYTVYTFTLTRENPLIDCEVDWTVAGSGLHPLQASRFEQMSGVAEFPSGALTTTVDVKVSRDDVGDFDRTFTLSLSHPQTNDAQGAVLVNATASAVVQNDDPAFAVALNANSNLESSGLTAGLVTFRIVRSGDTTGTATVDWRFEGDGASAATLADFGGYWPSGTAVFAAGESIRTLQVAIAPDSNFEPDEGFKVVLSNLLTADPNARVIVESASGVISNDDTGVFVSATNSTIQEGSSASFTLAAQGIPDTLVRVYWTLEGTGVSPANAGDLGSVTGHDGFDVVRQAYYADMRTDNMGNVQRSITVATVDDKVLGADETFRLRITEATNASLVEDRANVSILNDDALVAISPATLEKREGDGGETTYTFTVTRTGNVSQAATLNYNVSGFGDNPATQDDFVSSWSGEVSFAPGATSTVLALKVRTDVAFESDESFLVTLGAQLTSSTQIDPSGSRAIGVIGNDDKANLVFKPIAVAVNEGTDAQNYLSYEMVRNGDNAQALAVDFLITGVSADVFDLSQMTLGETQAGLTGTITIPAGQSRVLLSLPIQPNAITQTDRTLSVSISAPGFSAPAAIDSTIRDDDSGITLSLTSSPGSENNRTEAGEYVFTVTRSGDNLAATDVAWAVTGLGDNAARAEDFLGGVLPAGTLSFQGGQTAAALRIRSAGDSIVENNEMFRLSLLSSSDASQRILVKSLDASIVNDDFVSDSADVIRTGAGSDLIRAGDGEDRIEVGEGADVVYAGSGNDIVYAQGGADVMYGGAGDDVLWLNPDNIAHFNASSGLATTFIDGGLGLDTLALDGSSMGINLSDLVQNGKILSVEKIDITGVGSNQLTLGLDAFGMIDPNEDGMRQLFVEGNADDSVVISDRTNWTRVDDVSGYAVWSHSLGNAQLLIDLSIPQPVVF